jgi:hypothetical protein
MIWMPGLFASAVPTSENRRQQTDVQRDKIYRRFFKNFAARSKASTPGVAIPGIGTGGALRRGYSLLDEGYWVRQSQWHRDGKRHGTPITNNSQPITALRYS